MKPQLMAVMQGIFKDTSGHKVQVKMMVPVPDGFTRPQPHETFAVSSYPRDPVVNFGPIEFRVGAVIIPDMNVAPTEIRCWFVERIDTTQKAWVNNKPEVMPTRPWPKIHDLVKQIAEMERDFGLQKIIRTSQESVLTQCKGFLERAPSSPSRNELLTQIEYALHPENWVPMAGDNNDGQTGSESNTNH